MIHLHKYWEISTVYPHNVLHKLIKTEFVNRIKLKDDLMYKYNIVGITGAGGLFSNRDVIQDMSSERAYVCLKCDKVKDPEPAMKERLRTRLEKFIKFALEKERQDEEARRIYRAHKKASE